MKRADIELTAAELLLAVTCGGLRHIESLANGRKDRVPGAPCSWTEHIDGCAAEIAVARFYGLCNFLPTINAFKLPDVGAIQVRSTRKADGPLIIRPANVDTETFLLVIAEAPWYRIRGASLGAEAKQERYWRPADRFGPGYYAIPRAELQHLPERTVALAKGA